MTGNKSMAKSAREYIENKIIKTHKKIINLYA
jgi:hypothetical protein